MNQIPKTLQEMSWDELKAKGFDLIDLSWDTLVVALFTNDIYRY